MGFIMKHCSKIIPSSMTHGGFPGSSVIKNARASAGDKGLISDLGRSPGEGDGYPLQYSCLENPMDRGFWQATFHGVTNNQHNLATEQQQEA